jgi:hypothetical protein
MASVIFRGAWSRFVVEAIEPIADKAALPLAHRRLVRIESIEVGAAPLLSLGSHVLPVRFGV